MSNETDICYKSTLFTSATSLFANMLILKYISSSDICEGFQLLVFQKGGNTIVIANYLQKCSQYEYSLILFGICLNYFGIIVM